jgi:hypothetical protein
LASAGRGRRGLCAAHRADQWTFPWTAAGSGRHGIEVRATDDTGDVQTDEMSDPAPDGARGHHRIFIDVT